MISERAKAGFHQIFSRAAESRLVLAADDVCRIELQGDGGGRLEDDIVVLTVSSILFRLTAIFQAEDSAAARGYFLKGAADKRFEEVFFEAANMCCGAMNQDLLRYFPDLGMSTPYLLNGRCLPFLGELRHGYLRRYAININGDVRLSATICVCENGPVDFVFEAPATEETAGELELF